jgi:hypothetical protein
MRAHFNNPYVGGDQDTVNALTGTYPSPEA